MNIRRNSLIIVGLFYGLGNHDRMMIMWGLFFMVNF